MKYKLILLFNILVVMSSSVFSQVKPCLLDIKDSPTLRGFKLGMTKREVELSLMKPFPFRESYTVLLKETVVKDLPKDNNSALNKILETYKHESPSLSEYLKIPSEELSQVFIPDQKQKNTERFKNVNSVEFMFNQNKLIHIKIVYKTDAFEDSIEEDFYSEMRLLLGLPEGTFSYGFAECKNFNVGVSKSESLISIKVIDIVTARDLEEKALQIVKKTYEKFKKEKAASKGFTP